MTEFEPKIQFLVKARVSKGDKRRAEIAAAMVKVVAQSGDKLVSFNDIGLASQQSRQLIKHHYPDKDLLWEDAAHLVRQRYQSLAIAGLELETRAKDMLRRYIVQALRWPLSHREDARFWLQFFFRTTQSPRLKKVHDELNQMGAIRIESIITLAIEQGDFEIYTHEIPHCVFLMQCMMTGFLIQSQGLPEDTFEEMLMKTCEACFALFQSKD